MNDFYVYRYIRLDTNTPFYVGKGSNKRAFDLKKDRNQYFKNIVKSTHYELEFILEDLTEAQAFSKEKEFIKLYKSEGYCEANLTNGGEGVTGYRHTDSSKAKLSIANKGKVLSKKSRQKVYALDLRTYNNYQNLFLGYHLNPCRCVHSLWQDSKQTAYRLALDYQQSIQRL